MHGFLNQRHHLVAWIFLALASWLRAEERTPSFNRDIRPILSEHCFRCHGPDRAARQAELRLDQRDVAVARGAVVAGRAEASELIRRIRASDPDERMPPHSTGRTLSAHEARLLERWIDAGAEYETHWSFLSPRSLSPPRVLDRSWPSGPIDQHVLAGLESRGLAPSRAADGATLVRRVSLAITGLPPTLDERRQFLTDPAPDALERAVDRWLTSPACAENMALPWLDAARYADTNGYYSDFPRASWPWRDWVLQAMAENMPFDQFTVEQLAGDLLPAATPRQRLATTFNRLHPVTDETGVIDEEYRVSYVADRVETMGTLWLGLTLGCARCHDHKYDPISQREYYRLFALFNGVAETGLIKGTDALPVLTLPSADQERRASLLREARGHAEQRWQAIEPRLAKVQEEWLAARAIPSSPLRGLSVHLDFENQTIDRSPRGAAVTSVGAAKYSAGMRGAAGEFDATQYLEVDGPALDIDRPFAVAVWIKPGSAPTGYIVSKIDNSPAQRGFELYWYKSKPRLNLVRAWGRQAIEMATAETFSSSEWHHLVVSYDGSRVASGFTLSIDGQPRSMQVRRDTIQNGSVANDVSWQVAWKSSGLGYVGQLDELRLYERSLSRQEAADLYWHDVLTGAAHRAEAERTPQQRDLVRTYYLAHAGDDEAIAARAELDRIQREETELRRDTPRASVMQEMPNPRATFVLTRGQYDQPGERVEPGIPAILGVLPADPPVNRLALARWLVSPDNPLAPRIAVNRLWQQALGEGLVRTVNDFGFQGELPTHPELLDALAREFVRSGWDVQATVRRIVTSSTFRQSSELTPELSRLDPDNRLLARGPSFRLQAELIRDQALFLSGLLVQRQGGPSVKPYQPPGLWEAVSYNAEQSYEQDHGESLYRRGLYTFWKRQAPPPDMLVLDGPTRETCVVRRPRTNTPLQSLALFNDTTYVEAARCLAERILREAGPTNQDRARHAFLVVTARQPNEQETESLTRLHDEQLRASRSDPAAARRLLAVGESPVDAGLDPCELAAWTQVASVLLNLDETITQH